jgi:hypothetical protein
MTLINYMHTPHYANVDVLPVDTLPECIITHVTSSQPVTITHAAMNFQITLLPELFNKPFTAITVVNIM